MVNLEIIKSQNKKNRILINLDVTNSRFLNLEIQKILNFDLEMGNFEIIKSQNIKIVFLSISNFKYRNFQISRLIKISRFKKS